MKPIIAAVVDQVARDLTIGERQPVRSDDVQKPHRTQGAPAAQSDDPL
jgi:hypothetical protein